MAHKYSKAEWAVIVEEYKKSGQSQVAFSKEYGISPKTLGAHLRKEKEATKNTRSLEEWSVLIDTYKSSGMTRAAWCRKHGIRPDTMTSAERRLASHPQPISKPKWVELNTKTESPVVSVKEDSENYGIRIIGSNLKIEIDANYPVEKLAALLERLVG